MVARIHGPGRAGEADRVAVAQRAFNRQAHRGKALDAAVGGAGVVHLQPPGAGLGNGGAQQDAVKDIGAVGVAASLLATGADQAHGTLRVEVGGAANFEHVVGGQRQVEAGHAAVARHVEVGYRLWQRNDLRVGTAASCLQAPNLNQIGAGRVGGRSDDHRHGAGIGAAGGAGELLAGRKAAAVDLRARRVDQLHRAGQRGATHWGHVDLVHDAGFGGKSQAVGLALHVGPEVGGVGQGHGQRARIDGHRAQQDLHLLFCTQGHVEHRHAEQGAVLGMRSKRDVHVARDGQRHAAGGGRGLVRSPGGYAHGARVHGQASRAQRTCAVRRAGHPRRLLRPGAGMPAMARAGQVFQHAVGVGVDHALGLGPGWGIFEMVVVPPAEVLHLGTQCKAAGRVGHDDGAAALFDPGAAAFVQRPQGRGVAGFHGGAVAVQRGVDRDLDGGLLARGQLHRRAFCGEHVFHRAIAQQQAALAIAAQALKAAGEGGDVRAHVDRRHVHLHWARDRGAGGGDQRTRREGDLGTVLAGQ